MDQIKFESLEVKERILKHIKYYIDDKETEISLENVAKIENLYLDEIEIEDYSFLKYFSNLKQLCLYNSNLKNVDFLKGFIQLEVLDLEKNHLKDEDVLILLDFINLKELNLKFNNITNVGFVRKMKDLETLRLRGNKILKLNSLEKLNVRDLCLCEMKINDGMIKVINEMKVIRYLCMQQAEFETSLTISNRSIKYIDVKGSNIKNLDMIEIDELEFLNVNDLSINIKEIFKFKKILFLYLTEVSNEEVKYIKKHCNDKQLQFLYVKDINEEKFKELDEIEVLKVYSQNEAITAHMIKNNKLKDWDYSEFDEDVIYEYYCEEYVEHYLNYIDDRVQKETNHLLFLKKLYLQLYLPFNTKSKNYVSFWRTQAEYENYMSKYYEKMNNYERGKFKEFFASLLSHKTYDTSYEKNMVLISLLKESLKEYYDDYVCFKILYYYLISEEYDKAFDFYTTFVSNIDYNEYYFWYYEIILANKFDEDKLIDIIEAFLDVYGAVDEDLLKMAYNLMILKLIRLEKAEVYMSFETVEPILSKEEISEMVKKEIFDRIKNDFKRFEIQDKYELFINNERIEKIIEGYTLQLEEVVEQRSKLKDLLVFDDIGREKWEREFPVRY